MDKIFHISSTFKAAEDEDKDVIIRGMASTTDKDRAGDIIEADAWKRGLKNFRKNPVILFNHDPHRPIGKAKDIKATTEGLELEARISKAAGEVPDLIRDGVLSAFSVGFILKDAEYDSDTDTFMIKQVDLLEVSVVSVPANQSATFSVQKEFDTKEEYDTYVKSFSVDLASGQLADDDSASKTPEDTASIQFQEKKMTEDQVKELMKQMAQEVATNVRASVAIDRAEEKAAQEKARKDAEAAAAAQAAEKERVSAIVKSGAAELVDDLTKKFEEKEADFAKIIEGFQSELQEKSAEIQKMRESRYVFTDRGLTQSIEKFYEDYEQTLVEAKILGEMTGKGWNTSMGKDLMEKATNADAGVAAPSVTEENFESIISTTVERDIELALVLAPNFRTIQMNAASMVIPTIPDAGYAEWLASNAAGSGSSTAPKGNLESRDAASPGANDGITMGSKVLTVDKLVSKSYIADETEEDAIIPILPLIRDALIRAHARAVESALLLGQHATDPNGAPLTGLCQLAVGDSKTLDLGSPITGLQPTAANLLDMRQAMGKYGVRPADVIYFVSLDAYYDLLDDAEFQNINEVGSERALKIRGEIGNVYGSPVVICDEFPAKVNGNPFAIAVNPMHFVQPVLRGTRLETDRDVENQRQVLVATQRRGFDQIFTAAGQVVVHNW